MAGAVIGTGFAQICVAVLGPVQPAVYTVFGIVGIAALASALKTPRLGDTTT
ncbi:hypothetical protein [Arthrobacter sp. ZGTC131]|uniref:hypothetical protein n=1 Tax=Arthrobacter sp. ZGTC131 TaxID=2058898 RepID=UPI0015E46ED7|nr:hypothetical protein [Arthrobacter sp. ZGTC131]